MRARPRRSGNRLTTTHLDILKAIDELIKINDGMYPTIVEITTVFATNPKYRWSAKSTSPVRSHLKFLQGQGLIHKQPNVARSIRLTKAGEQALREGR